MVFQPGQSGNPSGRPVGSVNRQLQQLRAACDAVLPHVLAKALAGDFEAQKLILTLGIPKVRPVELPVEFSLEEGETSSARSVFQQAAAGELALSSAKRIVHELMPEVQREEKAIALKIHPSKEFTNAYLGSVMRG